MITINRIGFAVVFLSGIFFIVWLEPFLDAGAALGDARSRMMAVANTGDIVTVYSACNQTNDPIACTMGDDHKIIVTYFSGNNQNRKPYMSQAFWVDLQPRLGYGRLKRF